MWQLGQSGIERLAIGDFVENESEIRSVALSNDERMVVSGSDGGRLHFHCVPCNLFPLGHVYYFDLRTRSPVRHIQMRAPSVNCLTFCDDGRLIAAGSDGTVKVYDALGQELFAIEVGSPLKYVYCCQRQRNGTIC